MLTSYILIKQFYIRESCDSLKFSGELKMRARVKEKVKEKVKLPYDVTHHEV